MLARRSASYWKLPNTLAKILCGLSRWIPRKGSFAGKGLSTPEVPSRCVLELEQKVKPYLLCLQIPVGRATLGRIMNVIGEPIDECGPIGEDMRSHQSFFSFLPELTSCQLQKQVLLLQFTAKHHLLLIKARRWKCSSPALR